MLNIDRYIYPRGAGPKTLVALATCLCFGSGGCTSAPPPRDTERARVPFRQPGVTHRLVDLVSDTLGSAPSAQSNGYVVPTGAEASRVAAAMEDLVDGDEESAAVIAGEVGLTVERANLGRTSSSRQTLVLREAPGAAGRGWGIYAFSPNARSDVAIQVPHPMADRYTEEIGLELFRRTGARYLLVAGANRFAEPNGAADVSHRTDSVFHAIHQVTVAEGVPALQIHGFSAAAHPNYPEVVVSAGREDPDGLVVRVAEALQAAGLATCAFDGRACEALRGTANVQGRASNSAGVPFVHLELELAVRSPGDRRELALEALTDVLGRLQTAQ